MLAKRIIPCLDVSEGRTVKGIRFLNLQDTGDPVEQAKAYDAQGADELVFLDITASHQNREIVTDMVRRVADEVFIPFTVGGGLRTIEDIRQILLAGADKVSINSSAVKTPAIIEEGAKKFGSQCIIVAVDAKRRPGQDEWDVYVNGGRIRTGLEAVAWAREVEDRGAGEILLTSMDRDGTLDGYDLDLTHAVASSLSIPVIASGGAGSLKHLTSVLTEGRASAALVASLFHYRTLTIGQAKSHLASMGVPMRL